MRFSDWFRRAPASVSRVAPTAVQQGVPGRSREMLPVLPVSTLLSSHEDLMRRLRFAFGNRPEDFDATVLPVIDRYASYVHLLPATASDFFSRPGGMLDLGLQVALIALQGVDGQIFSGGASVSVRRLLEPKWRLATLTAGLCHQLHRACHVEVNDDRNRQWPSYLGPLFQWLHESGATSYEVLWPEATETPSLSLIASIHVIPPTLLQNLAEHNTSVVPAMYSCIGQLPSLRLENVLATIVRRATAIVIDQDLAEKAKRTGRGGALGEHVERYLLEALRQLISTNPRWRPNSRGSRLWYGRDGLFLLWPDAAAEILRWFEQRGLPGMPQTAESVLEVLRRAELCLRTPSEGMMWPLTIPGVGKDVEAVRMASIELLTATLTPSPEPLEHALFVTPDASPKEAAGHAGATAISEPPTEPSTGGPAPIEPRTVAEAKVDSVPTGHTQEPLFAEQTPIAQPELQLPIRVRREIRDAWQQIVGAGEALELAGIGLFVPLHCWRAHGLDPQSVMAELLGAQLLLVTADGRPLAERVVDGEKVIGFTLRHQRSFAPPTGK